MFGIEGGRWHKASRDECSGRPVAHQKPSSGFDKDSMIDSSYFGTYRFKESGYTTKYEKLRSPETPTLAKRNGR